jgi:hypothetical protein
VPPEWPDSNCLREALFTCISRVDIAEDVPAEDVRSLASEQGTEAILLVEDEQLDCVTALRLHSPGSVLG